MAVLRDYHCALCGTLWEELDRPVACPECGRSDSIETIFTAPKLGGFAAAKIRGRSRNAASSTPSVSVTVPEQIVKHTGNGD